MLSKGESGKIGSEDSNNGQLLHDIKAISKALYLHNPSSSKGLNSKCDSNRSKSVGKTRLFDSKSKMRAEDVVSKNKWNWKKPLKALTHIGNRKFSSCFYLHVHSIEGLPSDFDNLDLCVNWKRKEEIMRTHTSRVDQGIAEFEETSTHRCSVYGHRSGPEHSAKYETKLVLLYPSIVGDSSIDIGKHWIDLTKLLPLTLEELEEKKSYEKWTTSFKLTGKAKGATLNVSLWYSVMDHNTSVEANSNKDANFILKLNQSRPNEVENIASYGHVKLRRVGSVPNMVRRSHLSTQSMDAKKHEENVPNPGLGFSRSINLIYQNLDEANSGKSIESEISSKPLKPDDISSKYVEEPFGNECDDIEFTVIDQGIELSTKDQLGFQESSKPTFDGFVVETNRVTKIINNEELSSYEEVKGNSEDDFEQTLEELIDTFDSLLHPDPVNLHSPSEFIADEIHTEEEYFLGNANYLKETSNYKTTKIVRSFSLDDVAESVAKDFLNMLGVENCSPVGFSSDGDPESPRQRLLMQFEKEALFSEKMIFNSNIDCYTPTKFEIEVLPEDSDLGLSLMIQDAEQEQKNANQSLISKRKAKMLEKLETEDLMREWGLNERAFQNSPRCSSGGFGSPIYIPCDELVGLPPLGENLGPVFQTKSGGFLRSMNPSLFKNAKNGGNLIMQVSSPVVLPAELGSDIMETLRRLASVGIEELSTQIIKLMPLDNITGKTMQQVAGEATSVLDVPQSKRMASMHSYSITDEVEEDLFSKRKNGLSPVQSYESLHSNSITDKMDSTHYVSVQDFAPFAMDKIEHLSIEGLKVQSGLSQDEAPSGMYPSALNDLEVNTLMGLSVTLDEWLMLDAGFFSDEDHISEHTLNLLAAHHAKCTDLFEGKLATDRILGKSSFRKCGLLSSNLTIAFMVHLRDSLRNYEPVGAPMLALFQVERILLEETIENVERHEEEGVIKEELSIPQFKMTEFHIAGFNTDPVKKQQLSGCRWLIASDMCKTKKHHSWNLNASSLARKKKQPRDALWSISSCVQPTEGKWKELAALSLYVRNPDIIFMDNSIRS